MNRLKTYVYRGRWPLIVLAVLLLLYSAFGFLVMPGVLERQLVRTMDERLDVRASMESVRFNPFSFTTTITQLEMLTPEGPPLLTMERFHFNLDPSRLLLNRLRLRELTLEAPQLNFRRFSEDDDTFSRLATRWEETSDPDDEEEDEGEGMRVELVTFATSDGFIHYQDDVPESGFETVLGPVDVRIANLSTREDEQTGAKALVLELENNARLVWQSRMEIAPLRLAGNVALEQFGLTTLYRYYQDTVPFVIEDGQLDVTMEYSFALGSDGPELAVQNIQGALKQLKMIDSTSDDGFGTSSPFLQDGTLTLENGSYHYPEHRLNADRLALDSYSLVLIRDMQGNFNLQRMFDALNLDVVESDSPEGDGTQEPPGEPRSLQLALNEFFINDAAVHLIDMTPEKAMVMNFIWNAQVQDFSLSTEGLPFSTTLALESGGSVALEGQLQLDPVFDVRAQLDVRAASLVPLEPYLQEFARVDLRGGDLTLSAQLRTGSEEPLAYNGSAAIDRLLLIDTQMNEPVLSIATLAAGTIELSVADSNLNINELRVDSPYGRFVIREGGDTNIGDLFSKPTEETNAAEADTAEEIVEEATTWTVTLGLAELINASFNFTDYNLPLPFETFIQGLGGEVSGFSRSSSGEMVVPLELSLQGQVDDFGMAQISGAMNPLDFRELTDIEMVFTNIDLPTMSPYVIKFAGREVTDGRADLTLNYAIEDSALSATNEITIRGIELGDRVDSPSALDVPLDLAISLLTDNEGVIDLEIPVSGNVSDPQFDLGPAIRQAISNAVTSIVTAPFRLLGNLLRGGDDSGGEGEEIDLSTLRFRPGLAELDPPEQEKLEHLLRALAQRPALALEIPAPFDTEGDMEALAAQRIDERIIFQMLDDSDETQRKEALEQLYRDAELSPPLTLLSFQYLQSDDEPAEEAAGDDEVPAPRELTLDLVTYMDGLRQRLIEAETVDASALETLAIERQEAVLDYLRMSEGIPAERLIPMPPGETSVEDNWVVSQFDLEPVRRARRD